MMIQNLNSGTDFPHVYMPSPTTEWRSDHPEKLEFFWDNIWGNKKEKQEQVGRDLEKCYGLEWNNAFVIGLG